MPLSFDSFVGAETILDVCIDDFVVADCGGDSFASRTLI